MRMVMLVVHVAVRARARVRAWAIACLRTPVGTRSHALVHVHACRLHPLSAVSILFQEVGVFEG